SGEKTHDPTPKKLLDARRQGQIPKSTDIAASAAYLGLALALTILGPTTILTGAESLAHLLGNPQDFQDSGSGIDKTNLTKLLISILKTSLLPLFFIPAIAVLISLIAQNAITIAPTRVLPKFSKISPITSVKNKFGAAGLFEFSKSTIKLILACVIMVFFLKSSIPSMLLIIDSTPQITPTILGENIVLFLCVIFTSNLLVGGADYLWQVAEHLRKHRMTRKEVEDENKESEGDPHNKQARRQRGFEIAMNQMLTNVPDAAVVIVNPTHYAVALKWDNNSRAAPICVAKGVDEIASRIRETAIAANVPIFRDPPTARSLFSRIELDQEVEPNDYRAVAAAIRFARSMNKVARSDEA
ncbi:MAG: flagellar type III secretion system protein FlhB, partial [Lentilitoribacter sp.]